MTHSLRGPRLNPLLSFFLIFGLTLVGYAPLLTPAVAVAAPSVNVWWPTNGAHVSGVQPFKAMVNGLDVANYDLYWRVDGGQWNAMSSNYTDYQHKEAPVDVSSWTWHGSGPYVIDFSARQNGSEVASASVDLYVDNGLPGYTPSQTQSQPAVPAPANPVFDQAAQQIQAIASSLGSFYVDPNSPAAAQAAAWQSSDPADAGLMRQLAGNATASWFGDWDGNVGGDVSVLVGKARAAGQTPVLVAYAIPQRDCGGFSAGGVNNPDGYKNWINAFASGLGSGSAVVILEPDALAQMDCLSAGDQATRLSLMSYAVSALKQHPGTKVYIDAGHENWIDPATMASRLRGAGVAGADGFALNVSNYLPTAGEESYGGSISSKLGGTHFVVDTSRNGAPVSGWCNPSGAAIGQAPTTSTGDSLVDAFVWAKVPGESDGYCSGGPAAGQWWPSGALSLVKDAQH